MIKSERGGINVSWRGVLIGCVVKGRISLGKVVNVVGGK